jgi:hypothetical protein
MMGHPLMDLPLGGAIVPKEEIKRAALLKIEVNIPYSDHLHRSSRDLLCLRIQYFK